MNKLVSLVFPSRKAKVKRDDDFVDRMSHRYTCILLVAFCIYTTTRLYLNKPMTCWAPKHFTGSHTKFANSYCWVKNTYYLPWDSEIPKADEDHMRKTIQYYQWVPFILLIQAVFFYLPTIVWHGLNSKGGIDSDDILSAASTFQQTKKVERRDLVLMLICTQLHRFLTRPMHKAATLKMSMANCVKCLAMGCCGKRLGSYLVILFVVSKLLFAANVIAQLFILNSVLNMSFNTFGIDFFEHIDENDNWWITNPIFPRVTFCDFDVRRLGNVHRYTLQCVLPNNLYTEKMYIFLWYWMVFLAIATFLSLFTWLVRFFSRADKVLFIKNHLKQMGRMEEDGSKQLVKEFVDDYLCQDGAFVLRLIAHNTNNITTTEIICALWDHWQAKRNENQPPPQDPDELEMEERARRKAAELDNVDGY